MRKFSSNPEVKALADLVWDYFSREEQYQIDRRMIHGTPFDPWMETDKNSLMAAEQNADLSTLNQLLLKYRELDTKGRQKMACKNADKCPCGKPHCDCQENADEARLAWVRSSCKFAQISEIPAPDQIDTSIASLREEVRIRAMSALDWVKSVGEQSTYLQKPKSYPAMSNADMVVSLLKQALESAEKLKSFSDQQHQVVPGESATLGGSDKRTVIAQEQDIPMELVMAEAAKLGIPESDLTPNKILEIKQHLLRKKQVPPPAPAKMPGRGGNPHGLPRAKPLGQDPWRGVREDVA